MVARMRLFAVLGAVLTAIVVTLQTAAPLVPGPTDVALRSTDTPMTSTSGSSVINYTDPEPFNPCTDIPLDVVNGLGLGFGPPEQENSLRCKYDAGQYQMAVEAIVWRTYEKSLPADAVELTSTGTARPSSG